MWSVTKVLRISSWVIMGFVLCQPSAQAQENRQRKIPAMDQNTSKSFETATFGLG